MFLHIKIYVINDLKNFHKFGEDLFSGLYKNCASMRNVTLGFYSRQTNESSLGKERVKLMSNC